MSMTINTLRAKSGNYGSTRKASAIQYLVYHYTGNKTDTAKNNATYFHNNLVKTSAHYFVDENSVYQSVPDLSVACAVGGSKYSDCATTGGGKLYGVCTNANSISIEMCSTGGVIAPATIQRAVALGKELMAKYSIPVSRVCRHFDVNGKHCPGWSGWYGKDSDQWEALVKELGTTATSTTTDTTTNTTTTTTEVCNVELNVLKKGSKGDSVKALQILLIGYGYSCGSYGADGSLGTATDTAVRAYQAANGLTVDGTVGAKTWAKLLGA